MTEEIDKSKWPSCRYHRIVAPKGYLFNSPKEFEAAGPGWVDSPAKFGMPTHPTEEELAQMRLQARRRLSGLQRWVLLKLCESDHRLSKRSVYEKYFGIKCEYTGSGELKFKFVEDPGNKVVILSRSMARLKESGYIQTSRYYLTLTERGIEKAKRLFPTAKV